MAIDNAYATGTAVTVTTTEQSIGVTGGTTTGVPVSRTDAGSFQFFLDCVANFAKGDEYEFRVYEKARSGGTVRTVFRAVISDAQVEMFVTPPILLGVGWDATVKKLAGTDRAIDWSVRRVS